MVAVGIIAVVAAAVFTWTLSNLQLSRNNGLRTAANQCAQGVVERYRYFWNSSASYPKTPSAADPTSRPVFSDVCTSLPGSYTLDVNDSWVYNEDGTAFVPSGTVTVPAVRGVTVRVLDGRGAAVASLETRVGSR